MVEMPNGTWSSGVKYLKELVKKDVVLKKLTVSQAAEVFYLELEKQAEERDNSEALLATLQFWARGVCK
jgi:hypothetical protein